MVMMYTPINEFDPLVDSSARQRRSMPGIGSTVVLTNRVAPHTPALIYYEHVAHSVCSVCLKRVSTLSP